MKLSVRSMNQVATSASDVWKMMRFAYKDEDIYLKSDGSPAPIGKEQWGEANEPFYIKQERGRLYILAFGRGGDGDDQGLRKLELELTPSDLKTIINEAIQAKLIDLNDL